MVNFLRTGGEIAAESGAYPTSATNGEIYLTKSLVMRRKRRIMREGRLTAIFN